MYLLGRFCPQHTHTQTHTHRHPHTDARTHTHTQTHAHRHRHTQRRTHTDTHTCTQTHTDTHKHTCTQTLILSPHLLPLSFLYCFLLSWLWVSAPSWHAMLGLMCFLRWFYGLLCTRIILSVVLAAALRLHNKEIFDATDHMKRACVFGVPFLDFSIEIPKLHIMRWKSVFFLSWNCFERFWALSSDVVRMWQTLLFRLKCNYRTMNSQAVPLSVVPHIT